MASAADCPNCANLRAELKGLRVELAAMQLELRDLRGRVNQTSRNSSKPPSSDPPSAPPRPAAPPSGRKQGGQPGHPGSTRTPFAAIDVDRVVPVRPTRCGQCRKDLPVSAPAAGEARRIQVVEIPEASATVTEYVLERLCCPECLTLTEGEAPADVTGCIGPRFQASLAVLAGRYRGSRREVAEMVEELYGPKARISLGWLSTIEERTATALGPAYEEARRAVQGASVANADETSYPEKYKNGWLWVASTNNAVYFMHDKERSRRAAIRLLGAFRGILVTDRWRSYHHAKNRRQICLAHLKRNFQALVDRGGAAMKIGRCALKLLARVFALSSDFEEKRVTFKSLRRRVAKIRAKFLSLLNRGEKCGDQKAAGMCRDINSFFPCIWTFTRHEGTPVTNNLAERRLRPAVLWRKGSFGTQSDRGSRFLERILTVVQTLRIQRRSLIEFITQTVRNARLGLPAPRLLPDTG